MQGNNAPLPVPAWTAPFETGPKRGSTKLWVVGVAVLAWMVLAGSCAVFFVRPLFSLSAIVEDTLATCDRHATVESCADAMGMDRVDLEQPAKRLGVEELRAHNRALETAWGDFEDFSGSSWCIRNDVARLEGTAHYARGSDRIAALLVRQKGNWRLSRVGAPSSVRDLCDDDGEK
jgi:hypothetical protein